MTCDVAVWKTENNETSCEIGTKVPTYVPFKENPSYSTYCRTQCKSKEEVETAIDFQYRIEVATILKLISNISITIT